MFLKISKTIKNQACQHIIQTKSEQSARYTAHDYELILALYEDINIDHLRPEC